MNDFQITGIVHAVMENKASMQRRWTVTIISKQGIAIETDVAGPTTGEA